MKQRFFARSGPVALTVLLWAPGLAGQGIDLDVSVREPAPPTVITTSDDVRLLAHSGIDVFLNGSHTVESTVLAQGHRIDWSILSYNNDKPSFQVLLPLAESITLGPFAPGIYEVFADWRHVPNNALPLDPGTLGPTEGAGTMTFRVFADDGPAGDYNLDGTVEQGDLDLVLQDWGTPSASVSEGWLNHAPTDLVDQAELDGVLQNWGVATAPVFGDFTAVPEPGTALLFVAGMHFCLMRRFEL